MIEISTMITALSIVVAALIGTVIVLAVLIKDLNKACNNIREELWKRVPKWEHEFLEEKLKRLEAQFDALVIDMGVTITEQKAKMVVRKFTSDE